MYIKFDKVTGDLTHVDFREDAVVVAPDADEYGVEVDVDQDHGGKIVDIASLTFTGPDVDPGSVALIDKPAPNYLELTTDATDTADPINGIPDIPGDGVSTCLIKIQKKSGASGNDLTGGSHTDTVDLETDRGKLSDLRVNLVNGYAEVTLTSVPETCATFVSAVAEGLGVGEIQIQFAP